MLYKKLALPDPWTAGCSVKDFPKTRRIVLKPLIHINKNFILLLNRKNISIILVELFYSSPKFVSVIHSDCFSNDISKINWIYQNDSSTINWYAPNTIGSINRHDGHEFVPYQPHEVDLIESANLTGSSLIQAAVPHNVINGAGDRWALSIMLRDNNTGGQLSFNEALNRLSEYWNTG